MMTLIYLLGVVALFALPLIPALVELFKPSDVTPLSVPQGHDGSPTRFAGGFRDWVFGQVGADLAGAPSNTDTPLTVVGGDEAYVVTDDPKRALVCRGILRLADRTTISGELYARGSIECGESSQLRAAYSESTIRLARGVALARWAHGRDIEVGAGAKLFGRLTADQSIMLQGAASFQRMNSPVIEFGHGSSAHADDMRASRRSQLRPFDPRLLGRVLHDDRKLGRVVLAGDLNVPENSLIEGDLVVHGSLKIGRGTHVRGSVKARQSLQVGADCVIEGSAIAGSALLVGRNSDIGGPVVGELGVSLGSGARVGMPNMPATVTSERIKVKSGVVVHGTIWARHSGRVVAA